jgi:polyhydroxyalkanoate synthase
MLMKTASPLTHAPTPATGPQGPAVDDAGDGRAREAARTFDRHFHANAARFSGGLSPISLALAYNDWSLHLATQPANAARLAFDAQRGAFQWWAECLAGTCADSFNGDARFADPAWREWPFAPIAHAYRSAEAWWTDATALRGMTRHHSDVTRFSSRQWLDMLSPTNAWLTNPEVQRRMRERWGANIVDGFANALDDWRERQGLPPLQPREHSYVPGADVAVTPGRVVHRNHLCELIQYAPQTPKVRAEPVFIVPSWILKYYILDLSPHNSLVNWLVRQGHTVFIVSWRNPDERDALLSMDDYLQLGIFDSLAAIARRIPKQPVHACGYCLGGTLLSIGAAALARPGQVEQAALLPELKSLTMLAAETDFTEPGEMGVLIDESQVQLLEDVMAERGFLTGRQMASSFQFLRPQERVWSMRMREYLLGERLLPNDLMAWNKDVTRMPAVMHSEYLRRCQLRNELAQGRYPVEGRPVSLSDLRLPIFAVATETDHVSPWRSVYKLHRLTKTELSFVLTNGGHNVGIVSEPGHEGRRFALHTTAAGDPWLDADSWIEVAEQREGSWWPAWAQWLSARSTGTVAARAVEPVDELPAAPGDYVHVRYYD